MRGIEATDVNQFVFEALSLTDVSLLGYSLQQLDLHSEEKKNLISKCNNVLKSDTGVAFSSLRFMKTY